MYTCLYCYKIPSAFRVRYSHPASDKESQVRDFPPLRRQQNPLRWRVIKTKHARPPIDLAPKPPPSVPVVSYNALDLEEATQPPDLEEGLADDDANDEEVPPLDAGVGALGRVAVRALTDDNVLLLVLDLGEEIGEGADCFVGRIGSATCGGSSWKEPGTLNIPSFSRGSVGMSPSLT